MWWPNWMNILNTQTFRWQRYFEKYRDMRKGGLNPTMYPAFEMDIEDGLKQQGGLVMMARAYTTEKYGLRDITEADLLAVHRELRKEAQAFAEKCWHPEASRTTCNINGAGRPIITDAHSLQNSRVLKLIAPKGKVMGINRLSGKFDGMEIGRFQASTFRGMCNTHDGIFRPIEVVDYSGTNEQHFLHAYRTFLYSMHVKLETSYYIDYGKEWLEDDRVTREILNAALLAKDWACIETATVVLPNMYPIAASGSYYLEFDFLGSPIPHGQERMEFVYTSLIPHERETLFLFSYLTADAALYRKVGEQLKAASDPRLAISALLAPHTENIYYEPQYYDQFIKAQEEAMMEYTMEVQGALGIRDKEGNTVHEVSSTPSNYLANPRRVSLFGY